MMGENAIHSQLKKGQGETNKRLEALIEAQQHTNYLLTQLLEALSARPAGPAVEAPRTVTWGQQG